MIERVSLSSPRRAFAAVAGALAAVALLAACTSSTARTVGTSDGDGVVGVALPQADDAFWSRAGELLSDELTSRGYRVDLQYAAGDGRTQGSQVQNMLTKGADAIVVAPLSADALDVPLRSAAEDVIPVVAFERAIAVPGLDFAAVGDPEAIGRAQAQTLVTDLPDATGETPRIAVLAGDADDAWAVRRYDAAMEVLAPLAADGTLQIVAGATVDDAATSSDDDAAAAEDRTRALLAPADTDVTGGAGENTGAGADTATDAEPDAEPDAATGAATDSATDAATDTATDAEPDPTVPTAILALSDAVTRGVVAALTTPLPDATPTPTPTPSATASPTPSPTNTSSPSPTASPGPDLDAVVAVAPLVVGSGGDAATVRALRDEVIDATVFVDPREFVLPIADAVQALLDGGTPTGDGATVAGLDGIPTTTVYPRVARDRDVEGLFLDSGWLTADDLD